MTFLAPLALLGVLLLAIPIVVHLFKPRKMRETPFSSVRWLKQARQRLSRRIQWHQWLLFLMRAGCIFLLVLALARPLIGFMGSSRPTDRFVILDTSRSMACQIADRPTPMEQATDLTARIAQSAPPGDRTALILAGATPRLITPLTADATEQAEALHTLKPTLADSPISAPLPLIRSLLPRADQRDIELVFITDHLDTRWRQPDMHAFLKDLPTVPHVKIVNVGVGSAHNAWIADASLLHFRGSDERWIGVELRCGLDANTERTVRVTGVAELGELTERVEIKPGKITYTAFKLPSKLDLTNQVAKLTLEPADALASDDTFYLNLDTRGSTRVLIIEPDSPGEDGRPAGFHLSAVLDALNSSRKMAIESSRRTSTAVSTADIEKADVILLAGVPDLADPVLEAVENRVREGAGAALFLGPRIKTAFYNQRFHRPQQPAEGLLPYTIKVAQEGRPGRLTSIRYTHPVLAPLNDPAFGDLTTCHFRIHGLLEGSAAKRDAVLARIDDDTPAIVDRPLGAGRVLFFNTSANDEWSDLPKRKAFVPLASRLLGYLAAGRLTRSFTAGEPVLLPLVDHAPGSKLKVVTPAGVTLDPRALSTGGRMSLFLESADEVGIYQVTADKEKFAFVVNAPRTDSALTPMPTASLESWWAPAAIEVLTVESAREQFGGESARWRLWPLLVVLAGLLLIAETLYVHWLCPRRAG